MKSLPDLSKKSRRFSRFGENFMRETIYFTVSIVFDNNLQFFVVSFGLKLSINKKGKNLESHRLWRQIVSLIPTDAEKVLKVIINQHFSIEEAIQDAENRKCLKGLRGVMEEQLSLNWPAINEKFDSLVSAEALLPFAR
ncbi:hypothetical protein P5673_022854 [Acropora cervicornis]|uniref:Uncharacterized protein n=1 Tax=Acropora cervicornis TaxID=6130 RepID=A0AAD9UZA1_ACRCE|nr:hypothetical protein P5673_022854 [Acropora cervicornis]